jgi:hypothetical protein
MFLSKYVPLFYKQCFTYTGELPKCRCDSNEINNFGDTYSGQTWVMLDRNKQRSREVGYI